MGDYDNSPGMNNSPPDDSEADFRVFIQQFRNQFFPNGVILPHQHQPHPGQLVLPAKEDPNSVLDDPSEHDTLWDELYGTTLPPHPQPDTGQQPPPVWEFPSGVLGPSEPNELGAPPLYPTHAEAPVVEEYENPEFDPPGSVGLPPVQHQAAGLDGRADPGPPQFACPTTCGRLFTREQERNRHVRAFLPHWVYCPYPHSNCGFRCNRRDNLVNHWKKKHANGGPAPKKHQCQIYDPDLLVKQIVGGQVAMKLAKETALSKVVKRAQELGKENAWGEDWCGHKGGSNRDDEH